MRSPKPQGQLVEDGGFLVYDGPLYDAGAAVADPVADPVADLRDEVLDRAFGRPASAPPGTRG